MHNSEKEIEMTYREQYMASRCNRQRHDDGPIETGDLPADRNEPGREDDHDGEHRKAEQERDPETLQDLGNLEPEIRSLDFLLRGTPLDVI